MGRTLALLVSKTSVLAGKPFSSAALKWTNDTDFVSPKYAVRVYADHAAAQLGSAAELA